MGKTSSAMGYSAAVRWPHLLQLGFQHLNNISLLPLCVTTSLLLLQCAHSAEVVDLFLCHVDDHLFRAVTRCDTPSEGSTRRLLHLSSRFFCRLLLWEGLWGHLLPFTSTSSSSWVSQWSAQLSMAWLQHLNESWCRACSELSELSISSNSSRLSWGI